MKMSVNHALRVLLLIWMISANNLHAQEQHKRPRIMAKVDSVMELRMKTRTDTNYIARPASPWTIKLRARAAGNDIGVKSKTPEMGTLSAFVISPIKTTIGVGANYRGLGLSLTVNLSKIFRTINNRNLSISYYNNHFGIDFTHANVNSLTTKASVNESKWNIKLPDTHLTSVTSTAYYVFNGKRFSYPAPFTHSWIQKKSAGSFLVSASFYLARFESNYSDSTGHFSPQKKISMTHVALGGGYAYNYVPSARWLLHISAMPQITVWHKYKYSFFDDDNNDAAEETLPYRYIGMQVTSRIAITHSWNRYFVGTSAVIQAGWVGRKDVSRFSNFNWRDELFIGIRL